MGRGKGKRRQQQRNNQPRSNTRDDAGWFQNPLEMKNEDFESYYKEQGICPPEEWDTMMDTLKRPLPITFRINGSGKFAADLRQKLEKDFMSHFSEGEVIVADEPVEPPRPLPWYPNGLAWQMNFSRHQLRREPVLAALHEFIKVENEVGAITRQEAVSMVPPLFMDVQPHHRVLDMCAAPGSKTFQLLEALHAGPAPATGVVIANDSDSKRCNLLTHQTQRMRSPALMITNHEGQQFPMLYDLNPESPDKYVLFDRILCDVPCSGDGTLRKQPDIWRRWNISNGNALHNLQIRITLRACQLLQVGGRMVYSTCTFNPIENEAVVAEVLRRTGGAIELVDVGAELPNLKRLPGLQKWKVHNRNKWIDTWEEAAAERNNKIDPTMFCDEASDAMPLERCMRFLPHHQDTGGFFVAVLRKVASIDKLQFPSIEHRKRPKNDQEQGPAQKRAKTEEEEAQPATEQAVDTKETVEEEVPDQEPEEEEEKAAVVFEKVLPEWTGAVRGGGARGRQAGSGRYKGYDPIVPFVGNDAIELMKKTYGVGPDCKIPDALIARSEDELPKKLSYLSDGVKLLLRMDVKERLKVTYAGLKMFERQDVKGGLLKCSYRIAQEGIGQMLPYMTKQVFMPTVDEMLAILGDRMVALPEDSKLNIKREEEPAAAEADVKPAEPEEATDAKPQEQNNNKNDNNKPRLVAKRSINNPSTLQQIANITYGSCIATLRPEDAAALGLSSDDKEDMAIASAGPIAVVCWRGNSTLNVMVAKQECMHMVDKLQAAVAATGFALGNNTEQLAEAIEKKD